jgi:hypothetical protein
LGGILIYDLLLRATDLSLHYTDKGIMPIKLVTENLWEPGYFSIHALSGTIEWQLILFIIAGIAALALLLGYKTKFSIFLCFILLLSLHNRNPWILNSGDSYLRLLLFWSMFLPLDQYYSLDNLTTKSTYKLKHASLASFCLITQIILSYVMTGLLKFSPEWLKEGTAIYYALSLDQFAKPLGKFLLDFPLVLKIMTHSVILLEAIFPFFFIMPIYTNSFRTIALIAFGTFHIGLGLTMTLGLFVPVCLIALISLIPTPYLDKAEKYLNKSRISSLFTSNLLKKRNAKLENSQVKITRPVSIIANFILIISISIVLIWNLSPLVYNRNVLNDEIKSAGYILRLDQG